MVIRNAAKPRLEFLVAEGAKVCAIPMEQLKRHTDELLRKRTLKPTALADIQMPEVDELAKLGRDRTG